MITGNLTDFEIWMAVTGIFLLRYLLIAGLFYFFFYIWKRAQWTSFKLQNKWSNRTQITREIKYSVLTFFIYSLGVWLFLYWIRNDMTKIYFDIYEHGLIYFVTSIVIMIILHDTYFYWTHRLIHHRLFFKYVHKVHHTFDSPSPWAAFAFHPIEAIISIGIIPIILFVIPFHHLALVLFITFVIIYNSYIHLGFSVAVLKLFKLQNTPDDHDLHHKGVKGNYGLYFNFWDKIMGTYKIDV